MKVQFGQTGIEADLDAITEKYAVLSYIFLIYTSILGTAHHKSPKRIKLKEEVENDQKKMESQSEGELALEVADSCTNKKDAS